MKLQEVDKQQVTLGICKIIKSMKKEEKVVMR